MLPFSLTGNSFLARQAVENCAKAPHAFQAVLNLPYEPADCFKIRQPALVPARTFLSQLL